MSVTKRRHEAERWLQTAEEDAHAAEILMAANQHPQACFYSQQSGEKAVKALWYFIDADPWGHSVQKLIADFPRKSDLPEVEQWLRWGALLDKYYIPTRYPNGLPDLTPGQVYSREDALRGLEAARALIAGCHTWIQKCKMEP